MKKGRLRGAFILTLVMAMLLVACGGVSAAKMLLKKVEGTVLVSDNNDKELEVREKLKLYNGYGIQTEKESYAWVELDSVKLAKLDQKTSAEFRKEGKKLEMVVEEGNLFFHITEPLKEDETLNIRVSSMVVGIRGTCGWIETPENEDAIRVYIMEGKVECDADGEGAVVKAGEMAAMAKGEDIAIAEFSVDDIPSFVQKEAEGNEDLEKAIREISGFIPWDEAGLEDHAMDWRDQALAQAMAEATGIVNREILLSEVWEIDTLNLSEKGIFDISALGELKNLIHLRLSGNNISDVSALGGLKNLTALHLNQNNISDISALGGLTNLKILELSFNDISDIRVLAALKKLKILDLSFNNVSDYSPVQFVPELYPR